MTQREVGTQTPYLDGITNVSNVLRLQNVDAKDDASNHDKEGEVNETLRRASYFEQRNRTLVRAATEGAEMPTSSEEGSEGRTQRIIDILQPAEVESPEGEQSSNLHGYGLGYGRCKELLNEVANLISMSSTTGTSAAVAITDDRRLEGSSTVVVDEDSTRPNQDLENGRVPDEATGGGVAVETSSGDYHQDNDDDNESECRICQMSSATDVVINLGCRCKLDLGQAHGVCAETWFRFKGNRQCEICGEIAKNVQIPETMDNNAPSRQDTSIANNGHLPVDRFWWNLEDFLHRHYKSIVLIVLVVGGISFWFIKYKPHFDRSWITFST